MDLQKVDSITIYNKEKEIQELKGRLNRMRGTIIGLHDVIFSNGESEDTEYRDHATLCDFCSYCKFVDDYKPTCTKAFPDSRYSPFVNGEKFSLNWIGALCIEGISTGDGPDYSEVNDDEEV